MANEILFTRGYTLSIKSQQLSAPSNIPEINLDHIKRLTTSFGIIRFSAINKPDINSGYTLDDNAGALIMMCQHYQLTEDKNDLSYINIYFNFIKHCLQPEGYFLNYVNGERNFSEQNNSINLAEANGRAIWALGYLISISEILSKKLADEAISVMKSALLIVNKIHSARAMAFVIKGLYYSNTKNKSDQNISLIQHLTNRLVQMYRHETDNEWKWFESYFTYANSILSEALLCAWLATGESVYSEIAKSSFDFLLSKIFTKPSIKVISNNGWFQKGEEAAQVKPGGGQPIDIAYTILALSKFYDVFGDKNYLGKMKLAFNWFLGTNHLQQVIYNPCTGGCYDGPEESNITLNQGAESTVSYLMARLTIENV